MCKCTGLHVLPTDTSDGLDTLLTRRLLTRARPRTKALEQAARLWQASEEVALQDVASPSPCCSGFARSINVRGRSKGTTRRQSQVTVNASDPASFPACG